MSPADPPVTQFSVLPGTTFTFDASTQFSVNSTLCPITKIESVDAQGKLYNYPELNLSQTGTNMTINSTKTSFFIKASTSGGKSLIREISVVNCGDEVVELTSTGDKVNKVTLGQTSTFEMS